MIIEGFEVDFFCEGLAKMEKIMMMSLELLLF
jgi:hypothetical protein